MVRNSVLSIALLMGCLVMQVVCAQSAQLDDARAELQAGRDQIIREELRLDDAELAAFWPVYEDYVGALAPLRNRKADLIKKFANAYQAGEFTDEFASWLSTRIFRSSPIG